MALVYIDKEAWKFEYESCEKLYIEIEELLDRQMLEQRSGKYRSYCSQIHHRLKQFQNEVQQLSNSLKKLSTSNSVTYSELERRNLMVQLLQSKFVTVNQRYQSGNNTNKDYQELLRPSTSYVKPKKVETQISGWLDSDDDDDNYNDVKQPLINTNIKQQQQYLVKEQDDGLNELASIVSRQKNIAITISSEVDLQNEIVDDLLVKMDKTTVGIEHETKEVVQILKKDSTRGLWIIIILLLIANVFVAFS
ncbi:Target SNARE coiled-coil homology domain,SNARE [Cinara cedri]|uniref:Target SNARE coiled-coil homology domain,SNARE n=1 Tax=Cinara cedri TaxID=506608 RepID=A0A5E4NEH6_9HEMI|nr:Target SNARE coiled-coil homology domain,SNARE [Cinara cedri]